MVESSLLPSCLSPGERSVLLRFREELAARLGDRLSEVILFGSRARGEGHGDSDLDVLVAVRELGRQERRALLDIATDLLTETGLVISPTIVDPVRFDRTTAFATHVARDGVRL